MTADNYCYTFDDFVPVREIEATMLLAIWSCEALHGEAQVRLDAAHCLDSARRACVIDASTEVGRDINRIFVALLRREFGTDAFKVRRKSKFGKPKKATAA